MEHIRELVDGLKIEEKAIEKTEELLADTLVGKKIERLPLIFLDHKEETTPGGTYNMKEQFYEKENMLYAHLLELRNCINNCYVEKGRTIIDWKELGD
ncbi:hypothetical protein ACFLQR_02015 [Verrucomicrobiota bacterium]